MKKKKWKKVILVISVIIIIWLIGLAGRMHQYVRFHYGGNWGEFLCMEMADYHEHKNEDFYIFIGTFCNETIKVKVDHRSFQLASRDRDIEKNPLGYYIKGWNCYLLHKNVPEYQLVMYEKRPEHTISIEGKSKKIYCEILLYSHSGIYRSDLSKVKKLVHITGFFKSFYAEMTENRVVCWADEDVRGTIIQIRPEKGEQYVKYRIGSMDIYVNSFEIRFEEEGSGGVYLDIDGDGIYEYPVEEYVEK